MGVTEEEPEPQPADRLPSLSRFRASESWREMKSWELREGGKSRVKGMELFQARTLAAREHGAHNFPAQGKKRVLGSSLGIDVYALDTQRSSLIPEEREEPDVLM